MTFQELVSQAINYKIRSIEQRFCPDQYVGQISQFGINLTDFPVRDIPEKRPNDHKCLIMVLESPHVAEFSKVPCPANGKTGKNIRKWMCDVKGLSSYKENYGLVIINAIQYQCSLGVTPGCFRDDVFETVWKDFGETDFVTRLKTVYRDGDVILNCCTKGKGNNKNGELRRMVQQAIRSAEIDTVLLRRTHPASWHSVQNRESE